MCSILSLFYYWFVDIRLCKDVLYTCKFILFAAFIADKVQCDSSLRAQHLAVLTTLHGISVNTNIRPASFPQGAHGNCVGGNRLLTTPRRMSGVFASICSSISNDPSRCSLRRQLVSWRHRIDRFENIEQITPKNGCHQISSRT